jgi:hypothetical protein
VAKTRVRIKDFIKKTTRFQGGYRERREFGFGSSLAFSWIEQKVLTRDSQGRVIGREIEHRVFF